MELTPRPAGAASTGRGRRVLPLAVLALVLGALGFIVFTALSDATTYFLNADEALADQESLGDSRFRLQGMVMEGVDRTTGGATFDVVHNCTVVHVRHQGDPPQMFNPGIPVVVEGRWDESGDHFASDTLHVAHDAEYESEDEYEERIDEAEEGGAYDLADCPELAEGPAASGGDEGDGSGEASP